MKNIKKGIVLIYVLFLVTLAVIFATILLNNNAFLFNITEYFDVDSKLYSNIKSDGKILVDINREFNSNGSWFIDNISCPSSTSITMSWTIFTDDIWTILVNSGSIYCEWTYQSSPLKLYFNTWFTDIIEANYNGFIVWVTTWIWNTPFSDPDNTIIDFSSYIITTPDLFDDDFNSDNYMVTSTWNTSTWTYYLNSFQDDDVLWRKTLFWYVSPDFWFKKVFWNTNKTSKIINDNSNNNDLLNIKIWDVSSWILHFDIDKPSEMKLVKFDKNKYNNYNELLSLWRLNWILSAWIWYLQNNTWVLSLSSSITWNEYLFDFINNDYAVFLKSTWTGTLLYKITWETDSWTWIYITPIDDSDNNIVKYLWNEILINDTGIFIAKEIEMIYAK